MLSVFVRPKPCRIMTLLRDSESSWHLSKIAKNSETTYVYVTRLMSLLSERGLVVIEPKGKKKIVKLTDKGSKVAASISELMKQFES